MDAQAPMSSALRTGGRVVEGAGLENRYTRKGIVGSNPTLSANALMFVEKNPSDKKSLQSIPTILPTT